MNPWSLIMTSRAAIEAETACEIAQYEAHIRTARICSARREVDHITYQLSPAFRQAKTEALAKWQAHLDSLIDDGVPAILKGDE